MCRRSLIHPQTPGMNQGGAIVRHTTKGPFPPGLNPKLTNEHYPAMGPPFLMVRPKRPTGINPLFGNLMYNKTVFVSNSGRTAVARLYLGMPGVP